MSDSACWVRNSNIIANKVHVSGKKYLKKYYLEKQLLNSKLHPILSPQASFQYFLMYEKKESAEKLWHEYCDSLMSLGADTFEKISRTERSKKTLL